MHSVVAGHGLAQAQESPYCKQHEMPGEWETASEGERDRKQKIQCWQDGLVRDVAMENDVSAL